MYPYVTARTEGCIFFEIICGLQNGIIVKIGGKLLQSRPEFIPSVMIVGPCTAGMYRVMVLGKRMKY